MIDRCGKFLHAMDDLMEMDVEHTAQKNVIRRSIAAVATVGTLAFGAVYAIANRQASEESFEQFPTCEVPGLTASFVGRNFLDLAAVKAQLQADPATQGLSVTRTGIDVRHTSPATCEAVGGFAVGPDSVVHEQSVQQWSQQP
jgi:hypothetical protein